MSRYHTLLQLGILSTLVLGCVDHDPASPSQDASFTVYSSAPAPPFYARVERPFLVHTQQWAAVVFYRPPSCVRAGFNLLDFFDVPAAFACNPVTVGGFELRKTPGFGTPFQQELHGLGAVPVWLVSWPDMQAALADDILTIGELQSLASLVTGTATQFNEMLQPYPVRTPAHLVINASGLLADGRRFRLHFTELDGAVKAVSINVW